MSIHISSAVWKAKTPDPSCKLVLLKLADNANDAGECWPSITTIAEETGLARSTVCEKLALLEREGWLSRDKERRVSTHYTLSIPASPPAGLVRQPDYTSPPAGLDQSATRTTASPPAGPESSLEPSLNHQGTVKALEIGFENFWKLYPRKQSKKSAKAQYAKARTSYDAAVILDGLKRHLTCDGWRNEGGKYIPYAERFLSKELFLDIPFKPQPQPSTPPPRNPHAHMGGNM